MLQIIASGLGIYVLITGKLKVSRNKTIEGFPAKVAGGILTATLPVALIIGFIAGLMVGIGFLSPSLLDSIGFVDLGIAFLMPILAIGIGLLLSKNSTQDIVDGEIIDNIENLP